MSIALVVSPVLCDGSDAFLIMPGPGPGARATGAEVYAKVIGRSWLGGLWYL